MVALGGDRSPAGSLGRKRAGGVASFGRLVLEGGYQIQRCADRGGRHSPRPRAFQVGRRHWGCGRRGPATNPSALASEAGMHPTRRHEVSRCIHPHRARGLRGALKGATNPSQPIYVDETLPPPVGVETYALTQALGIQRIIGVSRAPFTKTPTHGRNGLVFQTLA